MRVLLSDGSGLTARQCATLLARAGHEVGVLGTNRLALTGFTRCVRRFHRVPSFGDQPLTWMDAALDILDRERAQGRPVDILVPTQEQVVALARYADAVRDRGVRLAVPSVAALDRVFDKVSAASTLAALDIPQPPHSIARDREAVARADLPVYVKTPVGTAGVGVRFVSTAAELAELVVTVDDEVFGDGGLLLQQPVPGRLVMVQGVFDTGELVAWHANARTREGVNGGASGKRSEPMPEAETYLSALGRATQWHGALSFDLVVPRPPQPPVVIDINPRLVEPGNAWRSATDLVGTLLDVSSGLHPSPRPAGRPGVATHQLLLALLAAAAKGRRAVGRELLDSARGRGPYAGSSEELTPLAGDPLAAIPLAIVTIAGLFGPGVASRLANGTVGDYSLSALGWRQLRAARRH